MESQLGWIDLSAVALQRLRRDLEGDTQGVVDEMGVLAIHAGYADRFFPGTSVLQTRPRYIFFTCWNYLKLNELEGNTAKACKELAEDWVRRQLLLSGNQIGIIGFRVERPAQPVDFIYWTALRKWGFYRGPDRAKLLSCWKASRLRRIEENESEDENALDDSKAAFLVPPPPHYWFRPKPREALTFNLTAEEADFLQKRLESLPPCLLSGAASRARKQTAKGDAPWEDDLIIEAAQERNEHDLVERARLASSLGLMIRAMYAALVERRRNETADRSQLSSVDDVEHYRTILRDLLARKYVQVDIHRLDLAWLRQDLPRLSDEFFSLLKYVKERVDRVKRATDIDNKLLDNDTLNRFCREEERRKQRRARLPDTAFGAERREDFDEDTVHVYPIDFRWNVVRTLLRDLHNGLRSET